jgi:hypothetical protein
VFNWVLIDAWASSAKLRVSAAASRLAFPYVSTAPRSCGTATVVKMSPASQSSGFRAPSHMRLRAI